MCGMIITRMETYNLSHMHKYENCKQNSYIYIYISTYIYLHIQVAVILEDGN